MSSTIKSRLPTEEQIRERAYEIYLARGCQDGLAFSDWIEAERELIGEQRVADAQKARSAVAGQRN